MSVDDPAKGTWLRNREQSIIIGVGWVLFAVVLMVTQWPGGRSDRIAAAVFVAVFLAVGARLVLMGVHVGAEDVKIRNVFRTHRLDWREVQRFRVGTYRFIPRLAIADLKDGRAIPILGIGGPPPSTRPRNRTAETLVARLNQSLLDDEPGQ